MAAYAWPILFALVFWWASTIAILAMASLPARTYPVSLAATTAAALAAMLGLAATAENTTLASVYCAFACGVVAWGWQIVTFYMGFVTGPQKQACPARLRGLARFVAATRAVLHHELAIVAMAIVIWLEVRGAPNRFGAWTFLVLWWMHLSAKLNVHFGVRNLGEQFLNPRMRYLVSFMTRRPMNAFFPFSVTASTIVAVLLAIRAAESAEPWETAGYTMLATLMALAILEHWFLVTPFDADVLWRWGVRGAPERQVRTAAAEPAEASPRARMSSQADDSDYPRPPEGYPRALEAWSGTPPLIRDEAGLDRILASVATGAFGDVERLEGVVRTHDRWIRFEADATRAHIDFFTPGQRLDPLVVAVGRRLDGKRLQAAFDACAIAG